MKTKREYDGIRAQMWEIIVDEAGRVGIRHNNVNWVINKDFGKKGHEDADMFIISERPIKFITPWHKAFKNLILIFQSWSQDNPVVKEAENARN